MNTQKVPVTARSLAATAAICFGCSAPPPRPVTPARVAAERADVTRALAIPDAAWGLVESRRHFVTFPLPDRAAWRVEETPLRLSATHLESRSVLWARAWRSGPVVSHAGCEEQARLERPDLFGRDPSVLVDRRPVGAPAGFDTEVAFTIRRSGPALAGVAVAIGARVRQCFAVAYATRADGDAAPEAVSHRLAFFAERVFPRLLFHDVADRVVPTRR